MTILCLPRITRGARHMQNKIIRKYLARDFRRHQNNNCSEFAKYINDSLLNGFYVDD